MASARWFSNRNPPTGPQNPAAPAAVLVGDCDGPLLDNRVTSLSAQGLAQELVPITSLASGADDLPLVVTPGGTIQTGAFPSLLGDANGNPVDNRVTSLSAQGLAQELVPITSLANAGPDNLALVVTPGGTIEPVAFPATSGGQAQQLTADADTVGLWTFDGNLLDTSGSGLDLALASGEEVYTDLLPGLRGALFNGVNTGYQRPGNDPALTLLGEMTVQVICQTPRPMFGTTQFIAQMRASSGSAPATNLPWMLQTVPTPAGRLALVWTPNNFQASAPNTAISYNPCLITAVRQADGSGAFYVNSRLVGTSAPQALPTGGTATALHVGFNVIGPANFFEGLMCSLRVKNIAINAAAVTADYNASLGPVFGTV